MPLLFGLQLLEVKKYGETRKSDIAVPKSWVIPDEDTILNFWPAKESIIDDYEEVYDTCPPEVYAQKFFKQCEREIGINAPKTRRRYHKSSSTSCR